jgi:hypothetical protein
LDFRRVFVMRHFKLSLPCRLLPALAGAALAAAATSVALAATDRLPAGSLRVQPVQIIDRQGFERPMVAMTMMVPAGWQTQADVRWNLQEPCSSKFQPVLKSTAADGRAAIELAAGETWGHGNGRPLAPGCPTFAHVSAQQYLQAWVQRHRPGATVLDQRPRTELSARLQPMVTAGLRSEAWIDTAQVLIGWQQGGQAVRETLAATVKFNRMRMDGLMPGQAIETFTGQSLGVLSWRAPNGQLDFRAFDAVWNTLRSGPEWQARINRAQQQMAGDDRATGAAISAIHHGGAMDTLRQIAQRGESARQTRDEIHHMHNEGFRSGEASRERMQTERVRAIYEVQPYRDPAGGTVDLPHHWRHAWKLRDGSFVLTDDADFNPERALRMPGQMLQPVR